ncbi:MAG: XRE family transcriptional regulator [Pseudonocardiaceae bacterium]|nr:XRE family transcriptional regulator [Pseudonocardiaceae bacterium]
MLRLAKRWGGVGFTASHLARRCELTVSRVQDYVSGRVQAQRVEIFERVADGLRIPGSMLDLAPRPWEQRPVHVQDVAEAAMAETTRENGESSVLRRDFMKIGAGIAATTLNMQLQEIPSGTTGNRIGSSTVSQLKDNILRLRRLDDHLGGADTYQLYRVEVEKTEKLLKDGSFSGVTKRELLNLYAEQAQQAGWAAFDAGWQGDAKHLFEWSFNAAKEANNAELAGNALALRSYQLLSTGTVATDLTDKSFTIAANSADPAVKSLLFQRGAWTYAVGGHSEQVANALGRAEESLASGGISDAAPDWAAWAHNSTELQIMAGRCWTELRRPLRAVPALEAAMAEYDDSHARDKALYLSWLADAYLDAGEVEHAATALGRAFDLSSHVASARPQQRLTTVLDRFEEHKAVAGVPDLLARRPLHPVEVRRQTSG